MTAPRENEATMTLVKQIEPLREELRRWARKQPTPEIQSHANIIDSNLKRLAHLAPDSDNHSSLRTMTKRNIQGLEQAIAESKSVRG